MTDTEDVSSAVYEPDQLDDGYVEIGSFNTAPGAALEVVEDVPVNPNVILTAMSNPISMGLDIVGQYYGRAIFVSSEGLTWDNGVRLSVDQINLLIEGAYSLSGNNASDHSRILGGQRVFSPYSMSDEDINTVLDTIPKLKNEIKDSDVVYFHYERLESGHIPGILYMRSEGHGMVTCEIGGVFHRFASFMPLLVSDVRKGISSGNLKTKYLVAEFTKNILQFQQSADYYEARKSVTLEQVEKINRAKLLVDTLPVDMKLAISDMYTPKTQAITTYANECRQLAETQRTLATYQQRKLELPPVVKRKKAELIEMLSRANSFCDVGTNPDGGYVFRYKNELNLKYVLLPGEKAATGSVTSINYGKPIAFIKFNRNRGNTTISRFAVFSQTKRKFLHPHVEEQRNYCLGDYPSHLISAFHAGAFYELGSLIWDYLNKYNPDSPLVRWSSCVEVMKDA